MITRVRLVEGDDQLVLLDRAAFRRDLILTAIDVPSPGVRAVTEARTDADGEDDTTTRHGARAVSLTLELRDTPAALLDEINAWMHPRRRPYLVVADTEWPQERRLRLRSEQWSSPIDAGRHRRMRREQLQWKAPDGIWEAAEPVSLTIAADLGSRAGRAYPQAWPRTYPSTAPSGRIEVVNPGSTAADQRVQLYGPAVGPRYTSDLTGETLAFTEDLVIPAGEYIEIDTRDRTALYMSDPDASRLNLLDFENSTWWQLPAGRSTVRYHPVSGVDIGAAALLGYRPAWL